MGGMKTAVSIPDDLFADAEALARKLRITRSRLYADALREYVARHDPDATTEALNRVWGSVDEQRDRALADASARVLQHVEW